MTGVEYQRNLLHEYFFGRLTELDEEERRIISAIRTKTGLLMLCDQLRAVELEKGIITRIYDDLRLCW